MIRDIFETKLEMENMRKRFQRAQIAAVAENANDEVAIAAGLIYKVDRVLALIEDVEKGEEANALITPSIKEMSADVTAMHQLAQTRRAAQAQADEGAF